MSSLSETILRNLRTERELAIAKGNKPRLAYLNFKIDELEKQMMKARDEELRQEMGML